MATSLPFLPASATATRTSPRTQATSEITGFTQQSISATPIWGGTLGFAPLDIADQKRWRAWLAETDADDGTFWAPLEYRHPDDDLTAGGSADTFGDVRMNDRSTLLGNFTAEPGDYIQVRLKDHTDISFVRVAIGATTAGRYELSHMLPFEDEPDGGLEARNRSVLARAIVVNPDAIQATWDAVGRGVRVADIGPVQWQEAAGHVLAELADLRNTLVTQLGETITTEGGDGIGT